MTTSAELFTKLQEEKRGIIHVPVGEQLLTPATAEHPILGYTFRKGVRITGEGAYQYQEMAVVSGERLLLWMMNEIENDLEAGAAAELGAHFESSIRAVPLRSIAEVSQRVAYSADSEVIGVSIIVILNSLDKLESHPDGETPELLHGHVYPDTLHFAATVDDAESNIPELLEFAATLTRAL